VKGVDLILALVRNERSLQRTQVPLMTSDYSFRARADATASRVREAGFLQTAPRFPAQLIPLRSGPKLPGTIVQTNRL
jgi:hypothetical protein